MPYAERHKAVGLGCAAPALFIIICSLLIVIGLSDFIVPLHGIRSQKPRRGSVGGCRHIFFIESVYLRWFLIYRNSRKISIGVKDQATIDALGCVYKHRRCGISMPYGALHISVRLLRCCPTPKGNARSLCMKDSNRYRFSRFFVSISKADEESPGAQKELWTQKINHVKGRR